MNGSLKLLYDIFIVIKDLDYVVLRDFNYRKSIFDIDIYTPNYGDFLENLQNLKYRTKFSKDLNKCHIDLFYEKK